MVTSSKRKKKVFPPTIFSKQATNIAESKSITVYIHSLHPVLRFSTHYHIYQHF